jgi:predicted MFS family arabinose efflux permease
MVALLAFPSPLWTATAAFWAAVGLRSMSDPVYTAFVQERVPEQFRARLTGFYSVTYSIGYSLGPAASGQLQHRGGFLPAFLMGAAVYLAGASLLWGFFRRDAPARTALPSQGAISPDSASDTV